MQSDDVRSHLFGALMYQREFVAALRGSAAGGFLSWLAPSEIPVLSLDYLYDLSLFVSYILDAGYGDQ
jgi:hypothetical protein